MEVTKLYELGTALRKRREELNMTREELALRIKISPKNLHAIEEGLIDNLPQPVFTRSFIRSYAQVVGMDSEELNTLLAGAFPAETIDNIKPGLTTAAREQAVGINSNQGGGKKIFLLILLALILLGAGTWFYFNVFKVNNNTGQPRSEAAQVILAADAENSADSSNPLEAAEPQTDEEATSAASDMQTNPGTGQVEAGQAETAQDATITSAQGESSTEPAAASAAPLDAAAAPSAGERYTVGSTAALAAGQIADQTYAMDSTAGPAGTTGAQTAAETGSASVTAAAQTTPNGTAATTQRITARNTVAQSNASATQPQTPGSHRILVSGVSGECWINVKFDNVGERNLRLMPGRHFVLDFKSQATLLLGNAAAVKVTYNGRPINYSADQGDVRIFRFPQ